MASASSATKESGKSWSAMPRMSYSRKTLGFIVVSDARCSLQELSSALRGKLIYHAAHFLRSMFGRHGQHRVVARTSCDVRSREAHRRSRVAWRWLDHQAVGWQAGQSFADGLA
jgi:hypothetical protein